MKPACGRPVQGRPRAIAELALSGRAKAAEGRNGELSVSALRRPTPRRSGLESFGSRSWADAAWRFRTGQRGGGGQFIIPKGRASKYSTKTYLNGGATPPAATPAMARSKYGQSGAARRSCKADHIREPVIVGNQCGFLPLVPAEGPGRRPPCCPAWSDAVSVGCAIKVGLDCKAPKSGSPRLPRIPPAPLTWDLPPGLFRDLGSSPGPPRGLGALRLPSPGPPPGLPPGPPPGLWFTP